MQVARFVFLLALAACSTVPAQRADDEAALRQIKLVDWPRAYREQDLALLDRILDDGYRRTDSRGNATTKADEMDYVRKNKPSYDAFRFDIKQLEIFDHGTAFVAGTGNVTTGGSTMSYESSNVFIKRGGVWKATASYVSAPTRSQ